VKWDKWDSLLEDITKLEADFQEEYKILKDGISQDKSEALDARHKESMAAMNTMSNDMSGLKKAIEDEQQSQRRKELLDSLSSIDPSVHFNCARKKHEFSTGGWLLVENEDFERWKIAPNSLLWLNGKGVFDTYLLRYLLMGCLAGSGKTILRHIYIQHFEFEA
jgi:hypothetical protein